MAKVRRYLINGRWNEKLKEKDMQRANRRLLNFLNGVICNCRMTAHNFKIYIFLTWGGEYFLAIALTGFKHALV